ncbi:MAG: trehalose-phosphatase, partial [Alphaproteobacteria bacterium]|nr:trehalose-phosphatase [Alphaproteobacteria bacterium]
RLSDKGVALRSFLDERLFRGRCPVFIGDDVTDEDAFRAVNDLGGHSIRVGNGRDSQARWQLPDVNAVLGWLEALPEWLERESKDDDINE